MKLTKKEKKGLNKFYKTLTSKEGKELGIKEVHKKGQKIIFMEVGKVYTIS